MRIQDIHSFSFRRYGRILTGFSAAALLEELKHTPLPEQEVLYVPSDPAMEQLEACEDFQNRAYGGLPIQIGYCNGKNQALNALEYHRNSEINIAGNDLILLLGMQQDVTDDYTYDTANVESFLVPAGTAVELYATTLHYAPVSVSGQPFRCLVILPRGTNEPLESIPASVGEDRLLTARNKWLIAHRDAGIDGAYCGLEGDNITIDA